MAFFARGNILASERQNVVEECSVFLAEGVSGFLVLALRKCGVGFQVMTNVSAPSLDEMPRELAADTQALCLVKIGGEIRKVRIEETQDGAENSLATAVQCRSDEQDVT